MGQGQNQKHTLYVQRGKLLKAKQTVSATHIHEIVPDSKEIVPDSKEV